LLGHQAFENNKLIFPINRWLHHTLRWEFRRGLVRGRKKHTHTSRKP